MSRLGSCGLVLLIWLSAASCVKELNLGTSQEAGKLVLMGELLAGDSAYVRAGKSISVSGVTGLLPEPLANLTVYLADSAGSQVSLHEESDFLFYSLFTQLFKNESYRIGAGQTYELGVAHPDVGHVSASVTVPEPFQATFLGWEYAKLGGDSAIAVDLRVEDPRLVSSLYVIEVVRESLELYRYFRYNGSEYSYLGNERLLDSLINAGLTVEIWEDTVAALDYNNVPLSSTDARSENGASGGIGSLTRVYLPGARCAGTAFETRIVARLNDLIPFRSRLFNVSVRIKSVNKAYYDYLKGLDIYSNSIENSSGNIIFNLSGNVVGGFGMVGGAYCVRFGFIL